jgi:sulfopyruvate decarboxylase TPP-binding subunit
VPMAQGTAPSLSGMGVIVRAVDDPHDVAATVEAAARLAFNTSRAVAVLIGQRVIGAKEFGK